MAEIQELVKGLTNKHGRERKNLIPVLQGIVDQEAHLSRNAMLEVAKEFDVSAGEVYGVASFYSFLDTEASGKYKIRICKSITCDMKGKNELINVMEGMLKIKLASMCWW